LGGRRRRHRTAPGRLAATLRPLRPSVIPNTGAADQLRRFHGWLRLSVRAVGLGGRGRPTRCARRFR
jgi:hypothetical protein